MGTKKVSPYGGVLKQLLLVFLILAAIYMPKGLLGFRPFLNLDLLLLVPGGAFLLAWTAYPLKELFRPSGPEPLLYAAGCAMAMGVLAMVLGLISILASVDDVMYVPRWMAQALSSLLFGIFLSEVILVPMAERLKACGNAGKEPAAPSGQGKRLLMGILGLGMVFFSLMVILYSLTAAMNQRPGQW